MTSPTESWGAKVLQITREPEAGRTASKPVYVFSDEEGSDGSDSD